MKKIFTILPLLAIGSIAFSQRLLTEDFNYANGQLTSAGGGANVSGGNWVTTSGTGNYLPVVAGTLTYPGYSTGASSTNNNKISLISTTASAEDAYAGFTAQTSGTVYVSFLVNVANQTGLADNTATGDFFAGFLTSASTSTYNAGRLYIRKGTTATSFALGVAGNTPANTPIAWSTVDYALATTHLVTIAYSIVPGTINDETRLFVDRPVSVTEPVADATSTYATTGSGEPADVSRFFIRQGTNTPNADVDGIKVSMNYYDATLPLNLTSFKGSLMEKAVQLLWTSTNEQNVKGYAVERSSDGRSFNEIGNVDAKNAKDADYSFNDNTPLPGTAYYRLRITDRDGLSKLSKMLAITYRKGITAQVFPNPTINSLSLSHSKAGVGASIKILSASGQQLKSFAVQEGSVQTSFAVSDLTQGSYLLIYENEGEKVVSKFVKK